MEAKSEAAKASPGSGNGDSVDRDEEEALKEGGGGGGVGVWNEAVAVIRLGFVLQLLPFANVLSWAIGPGC